MLMFELLGGGKILTLNLTSNLTATRTGGSITFTVVALGGASPYAGAFITFYKKNSDNSLTTIGTGTTNASGIVNLTYTLSGTETLTNKTIDADNNTITNIGDSELSSGISATKIGNGDVDNTELSYLNGVTSAIQTQIDTKASTAFAIAQAVALG